MGRQSKDGAVTIMQGRTVGGTTVVNWTSSFRTPDQTLKFWADHYQVKGHSVDEMAPWFARMEERVSHIQDDIAWIRSRLEKEQAR